MNTEKTISDKDLMNRIENALESIRDYLEIDGGDVKLVEVTKDMVAKVELLGNCSSCSISEITMKAGIEETIKQAVPEIKAVVAINDHSS
ncbi:MAG: NifU family protein [Cytophagales bacterium]|nr:NifU family protein [Cytophagales bacterium]